MFCISRYLFDFVIRCQNVFYCYIMQYVICLYSSLDITEYYIVIWAVLRMFVFVVVIYIYSLIMGGLFNNVTVVYLWVLCYPLKRGTHSWQWIIIVYFKHIKTSMMTIEHKKSNEKNRFTNMARLNVLHSVTSPRQASPTCIVIRQ
jgi:hypothetical protein